MAKATLDKDPSDVARMFDDVGKNYDITNTILSFGQDRMWRRRVRERLALKPGEKVLDLAAGSAVSTEELAKSGAWRATSPRECSLLVLRGMCPRWWAMGCSCPSRTRPSTL